MLLARKGYVGAMDRISTDHVDDLVVFVRGRPERTPACGNVVEQILDGDLCSLPSGGRLRVWRLAGLCWNQLAAVVMGAPGAVRVFGLGRDSQVGNVTDACQGLSAEAISGNGLEVLKGLQLGGGEALAQDGEVVSLILGERGVGGRGREWGPRGSLH